ncbi:RNA polymerase II degradation factor 1-like [Penaeus chinensis]|uniref:RNA polymerase II degradation factor 1-like n=1 Tax=Penaeus chinensis TaxID=139456 RepID=UPI001FB5CC53|nr:RNA polymerase II degradation factor 1-like [Penaeus chinensis]
MGSRNYQDTPMPRRHSLLDVTLAPKWRHRSHSLSLVNVSGFSPGLSQMSTSGSQRTPATPCFVSPRMAFSTQFSYDSPIQILTSSNPRILTPGMVSQLKGRFSMKRLSRRWKIVLIMFFTALGAGLFISRKMGEISSMNKSSCEDGGHGCEPDHRHPGLAERFMDVVSIDKVHEHIHTLARGLRKSLEGEEGQQQGEPAGQEHETENEDDQTLEETSLDTGTTTEDLEEQEQEQNELDDEWVLDVPDRYPRGLREQTTYGTRNSEGGRKMVESEYEEDGEDAPAPSQRASHLAPQQRQQEVTNRRTGSPPKKIVAAQSRVQGRPSSARSQQQNQNQQQQQQQQNKRNYQQYQQQNLGQRRSEGHRGQRPPPQEGRRYAQGKRPVRTPPGVNPRRYEM